ncbi:hypothetical protein Tco_0890770 [Tanacetum coccineum]|uniref:Uncharacterized protein n=1 Tax=Tanacetum coccineum TaxID=301880 RepID=A0ABQ5C491_9ASTR
MDVRQKSKKRSGIGFPASRCHSVGGLWEMTKCKSVSRRSTKVDESKLCDIPVVYTKTYTKKEHNLHLKMTFLDAAEEREVSSKGIGSCLETKREGDAYTTRQLEIHERTTRLYVMDLGMKGNVRTLIMEEVLATKYSVYPGVNEAVARHRVHVSSIPDRDGMYIEAEIGESKMIGPELEQETTKTDGQSERTFRTLENRFRACVRNLVVVGILTFCEADIGESKMIRLELEQETTKVVMIKERPKEAKDHQES